MLVPDYAKTERNTLIKLILMMTYRQVPESEIINEFYMVGIETDDALSTLAKMLKKYTFADESIFTIKSVKSEIDELTTISLCCYSISEETFDEYFASTFKNAYFIIEDEKLEKEYVDSRLFNHITQIILPGQFAVYDGKYYIAKYISPEAGCILRRAADSYNKRCYYRQLRKYYFEDNVELINAKRVMDVEITVERRNFTVITSGYLEMDNNRDLRRAKHIDLSKDPNVGKLSRNYKNKTVLTVMLPETDVNQRFTISVLLSEMFRSIFPNAWQYIAVLSACPNVDAESMLNKLNYEIDGTFDVDRIYIVEDSDMDLGLLEAVENNLMYLFEIMSDYLSWHFEQMKVSASKDPVIQTAVENTPKYSIVPEERRKNVFSRIAKRIMDLFTISKKDKELEKEDSELTAESKSDIDNSVEQEQSHDEDIEITDDINEETEEEPDLFVENAEAEADETSEDIMLDENDAADIVSKDEEKDFEPHNNSSNITEDITVPREEQIILHTEGEDLFSVDGVPDDLDLLMPVKPSRYQKECFLKFGFEEIDSRLEIEDVNSYLIARGWGNSALKRARKRIECDNTILDISAENHCDFCGVPLSGISYERLVDGRTRCNDCSMSAVNNVSELKELFNKTEAMLEIIFNISIHVPIVIKTTDARTIARHSGQIFVPSTQIASRALGFAQRKGGKYSLFLENGSPRLCAVDTIVHELTHIWQYINWNDAQFNNIYGMKNPKCSAIVSDIVYEGMAVWASVQMLYTMGETFFAQQQEIIAANRTDVYGLGFLMYQEQYGLEKSGGNPPVSPFMSFPPLEPDKVRAAVKGLCKEEECKC